MDEYIEKQKMLDDHIESMFNAIDLNINKLTYDQYIETILTLTESKIIANETLHDQISYIHFGKYGSYPKLN